MSRRWLLLLLLIECFASPVRVAARAPDNPKLIQPLRVGAQLPKFVVHDESGAPVHMGPDRMTAPTVLVFYRGGWNGDCRRHLRRLKETESALRELGYLVYFLSADQPAILRAEPEIAGLPYTLLSDNDLSAARALGIAYQLPNGTVDRYKSLGVDLEVASGRTHHQLAAPAAFIVDRTGMIRFMYWNPNVEARVKPDELLAAAKRLVEVARSFARAPSEAP